MKYFEVVAMSPSVHKFNDKLFSSTRWQSFSAPWYMYYTSHSLQSQLYLMLAPKGYCFPLDHTQRNFHDYPGPRGFPSFTFSPLLTTFFHISYLIENQNRQENAFSTRVLNGPFWSIAIPRTHYLLIKGDLRFEYKLVWDWVGIQSFNSSF